MSFDIELKEFLKVAHIEGDCYNWAAGAAQLGFGPQKREALTCAALNLWKVARGGMSYSQWKKEAKAYGYKLKKVGR